MPAAAPIAVSVGGFWRLGASTHGLEERYTERKDEKRHSERKMKTVEQRKGLKKTCSKNGWPTPLGMQTERMLNAVGSRLAWCTRICLDICDMDMVHADM